MKHFNKANCSNLCISVIEYRWRCSLRSHNLFWKNQSFTGTLCGDQLHGKVWNVMIKYMEKHGMSWAFANCTGDYGEKVRLEIKTQQPTLHQDKQHEHDLNPTLWKRKTPSPRRSLQPNSIMYKPRTFKAYLHAHISIKQANKVQNWKFKRKTNQSEVEILTFGFLYLCLRVLPKISIHQGWSWNASSANT
jgi:hypothetical protein